MKSVINQQNYEEFFLLYVDGELSATDKLAVEQFVQANPGLAVELEMLQQVQLADESIVFGDKNSLLRSEATEIGPNNYEEQFLLYVDNELNGVEKEKVETFVLQHPAVQESFTLLKKTKLEPETLLFPDKQSLYRKEEKERPVFYMRWQRIAVAAAVLGFAVLTWTLLPDTKNTEQNIVSLPSPAKPVTGNQTGATNNNTAPVAVEQSAQNIMASVTRNTVVTNNTITTNAPATVSNNSAETNTLIAKNDPPVTAPVTTTREDIISTNVSGGFETKASGQTTAVSGDNSSMEAAVAVKVNNPNSSAAPVYAAVYKELDTDNEEKSLLLGSLEINKDKLRGFFRKAGSLFRSKSKAEDDKTESAPSSNTRSLE